MTEFKLNELEEKKEPMVLNNDIKGVNQSYTMR